VRGQQVELIFGEHPHSRSDNRVYARYPDGRIEAFDGHRVLISVGIESRNYLKESHLSGDEVRKGGTCTIGFNGHQVYEFFFRDPLRALLKAHEVIPKLQELPVPLHNLEKLEEQVGRKIFYREQPAVIERFIIDQGAVILKPDGAAKFARPCWDQPSGFDGYCLDDDELERVKDDILSPSIYWFRS
jgi:hypothetical protein